MSSRRTLKAASAIREVVSTAILTELRDPRIENVTVTFVEVSGDMRWAKVHVSIMGDKKQQDLCMHGLQKSAGYLQKRVSNRIDTRYTPRLQFVLDEGIKNAFKVSEILNDVLPENEAPANEEEGELIDESTTPQDEQPDNAF
ncbi:MAG: ribosome-binding factor A [Planctomycetaceae bacterium]|nr:ribosome-binding factor A [Planctomycetaceae bacterium]